MVFYVRPTYAEYVCDFDPGVICVDKRLCGSFQHRVKSGRPYGSAAEYELYDTEVFAVWKSTVGLLYSLSRLPVPNQETQVTVPIMLLNSN